MKSIRVLLLLLSISIITAQSPCCDNLQELYTPEKICQSNGTEIIKVTCNGTFIPIEDLTEIMHTLSDDGRMINVDGNNVEYCISNGTKYIVCYKPSTLDMLRRWQAEFYIILIAISLVFVIMTILVYAIVPKLMDLQGICIMHTLAGLAMSYILLLTINKIEVWELDHSCEVAAFILYTSIMYMYLWQVVLAFHIWRVTVMPNLLKTVNWLVYYHIFGIGGAVVCLLVTLAAHHAPEHLQDIIGPGFGETSCWFYGHDKTWIFLYGPMLALILINLILYVWTVWFLWKNVNLNSNIRKAKVIKAKLLLCVKNFIIMGFTWMFEVITFSISSHLQSRALIIMFLFLPDLLNLLQGLFLFLVLVVFRKRARRLLATQNIFQLKFPTSWTHLEDEEVYSAEERIDKTEVEYTTVKADEGKI